MDHVRDGQAAYYRGRQARDLAIRAASASGLSVEEIAQACELPLERVEEIVANNTEAPLVEASRIRKCSYCLGSGRIVRARACQCRLPNGSCDGSCEMGIVYLFDFCDCEAGQPK